ncbi:MAG: VWA domain-containing protein [Dehalococcoidia bacterium]
MALAPAVFAVAIGSFGASAQESTLRANIASVSDDTYPHARLVLNIEDDSAAGLAELGADNIAITANGAPAAVVSAELASSQDEPLDLLLVMDTSGSMAGAAMTSAKDAAKALVSELAASDRVAVVSFADQVVVVQDYTQDRQLVTSAVDGLVAQGNTALYQATAVAAFKAVSSTATRKAVVLLSDGADFGGASAATRDEAINAARNAGVPYFTIAQGSDLDLPYLREVADVSKGRLLEAVNPADLRSLYLSVGRLLRNQYIVTFDATGVAALPESTINVRVSAAGREASDEATYRPAPGFAPLVDISGIEDGDTVDGVRDILVNIGPATQAARVLFFVDGSQVAEMATGPYVFRFDAGSVANGEHVIRVVVEVAGQPLESSVSFTSGPPVAATGSGGGGLPLIVVLGAAIAVVIVGSCILGYFKFRHRGTDIAQLSVTQRTVPWAQQVAQTRAAPEMPLLHIDEPEVEQESIGEPLGVLISRGGADLGSEYTVGAAPVSMGSAARCGVRIDDAELAAEEARTWVRGGHLMVHRMTRLSVIAADGTSGGWMILEPGDTFAIGEHVFEFRMLDTPVSTLQIAADDAAPSPALAPVPVDSGPVPNVLRDPVASDAAAPASQDVVRIPLADMMPSSEGGPRVHDDVDTDDEE